MNFLKDWTSGEGRLSQKGYALYFLAPGAALIGATWLAFAFAPGLFGSSGAIVLIAPWMLFLAITDGQNIRRYHDIGNSGRLYRLLRPLVVVLPLLALFLNFVLPAHMAMAGDMQALVYMMGQDMNGFSFGPIPMALFGLTLAGMIYNVGYLAAMPGMQGPNDYGPDPRSGANLPGIMKPAATEADDRVERALAQYQAQQNKPATPMIKPMRNGPAGASFGRKRT